MAIVGVLAAIIVPRIGSSRVTTDPVPRMRAQLPVIRSQLALYNVQNPATPYDDMTDLATFWNPLVKNGYLQTAPQNQMQDNSSVVVASPRKGAGWVWAKAPPGDMLPFTIYAIDEDGNFYSDPDTGRPW
jgi:type II secretory pathway pseudopilin PulG